jgi:hypothetical protein
MDRDTSRFTWSRMSSTSILLKQWFRNTSRAVCSWREVGPSIKHASNICWKKPGKCSGSFLNGWKNKSHWHYYNDLLTYLLTYFTPCCRILFEKLIETQLVEQQTASLWNPKVHYHAHKSPPPEPILSQPNTVWPIDPYLPKVHLMLSSHLCLGLPSGLLLLGLPTKTL